MNKFLKYVGIAGLAVGVISSIILVGRSTSGCECDNVGEDVKNMVDPNEV